MKNLCIFTLLFFIALPAVKVLACDKSSLTAAEAARDEAQKTLDDLNDQNLMKGAMRFGKALGQEGPKDMSDFSDDLQDAYSQIQLDRQIKAAKEALAAAEVAYSNALMAYTVCRSQWLLEEITGPCGNTYKRLHRSDHALTYCYVYGKSYYKCEGAPCAGIDRCPPYSAQYCN